MRSVLATRSYLGAAIILATVSLALAAVDPKPSAEEAMQAWARAATPGAPHKQLEASAGEWDTLVTHWQAPGATPTQVKGHSTQRMTLDGRFLEEEATGEMMGHAFNGHGLVGYDNLKQKYTSVWVDNMSTAVFTMLGDCSADHAVCRYRGSFDNVLTGRAETMRLVITATDADRRVSEFFVPAPDGKEFKTMEIVATRRK